MVQEIMLLLVNDSRYDLKASLLNKAATKDLELLVTSLYCLRFFDLRKNKDPKRISKSNTNAVLVLKFLWTSKFVFL